MQHPSPAILLALAAVLAACGPLGVAGGPTPAASKKPKAEEAPALAEPQKPAPSVVPAAPSPDAAAILGKMKEPLALARQQAFVTSLHDVLPVGIASGGLGVLADATGLVANNGAGVLSNNGGGLITDNGAGLISDRGGAVISDAGSAYVLPFGLLQAAAPDPAVTSWERRGLVMVQRLTSDTTGQLSMYDGKKWDRTPGADNEDALVDRFDFEVDNIQLWPDDVVSGDFKMKIVSSKRIGFVDALTVRQHNRLDGRGGHVVVKFEYLLGFDVRLADGTVDRADLLLVAEAADLERDKDAAGRELPGTEMPARMALGGSNGHGNYEGEVRFPIGGAIESTFTHTRPDGAKTASSFALRPDGSSTHASTSENGRLALRLDRGADGRASFEVRDLAGAAPQVLPDVVAEAGGIGTFDFGTPEKPRARLF